MKYIARLFLYLSVLVLTLLFIAYLTALVGNAQTLVGQDIRPDMKRALASRVDIAPASARKNGYTPLRNESRGEARTRSPVDETDALRRPARLSIQASALMSTEGIAAQIGPGTPLGRVLHTSQLSMVSTAGTVEQYVDSTGSHVADERTTFDADGGAFDVAVGLSGTRYEVYSATLNGENIGVLTVALDTNGDYVRDSFSTYNLKRDFNLPSAAAVTTGTSKAGREFVIVSSSGFYNFKNPNDPNNEPTAGVVLLVRDQSSAAGFDNSLSRELVRAGDRQLNNANALALLPNNDLLIADFDSDQLRIVRDTNGDGIPDTLDPTPYYSYRFSNDAPLDIAVNSRGVVFSHSSGNNAVLLAIYDDNHAGRGNRDEVVAEGLSLDNNLFLHGLTVDLEGTVYVIENATGASGSASSGGNGGTPRIDAFPDPGLDGHLRDGAAFARADDPNTQALSGLAFVALASNPINDEQLFVRQHYLDFLDREPDPGGLDYWTRRITSCGNDARCANAARIDVSAAFFISTEFQDTGYFVYRLYKASFGGRPTFAQFMPDRARVIGGVNLEASKQAFAGEWVQRPAFLQIYPQAMTPDQFVNKLYDTAGLTPFTAERQQQIQAMTTAGKTRVQVLKDVIETTVFRQNEFNPAFVLMQYFGYLRRDPDAGGYQFWLNVLNNRDPNNYRGMVCAFITSREYQERFGDAVTRTNVDCGP